MATPKLAEVKPPSTYVSGHCGNGNHEGEVHLSARGSRMPTCRGVYEYRFVTITCTCFCHQMYAMMRAEDPDAFATPSEPTPMPESPATGVLATPEGLGLLAPFVVEPPDPHRVYGQLLASGLVSAQLSDMVRRDIYGEKIEEVAANSSARRKRGELEQNVEVACRLWLDGKIPFPLMSTDIIGLLIDAEDPPSQGAVHAVLKRWELHGYATIGKSPMRFLDFSDEVKEKGIDFAKARSGREKNARAKGFF